MKPEAVRLLVLTDRRQALWPLHEVVSRAIDGGVRTVVLGEEDLPEAERRDLAARLRVLLDGVGGQLLTSGGALPEAHGAHLLSGPQQTGGYFGRACRSLDELAAAAEEGAAFATLAPIFPTRSSSAHRPLGLAALSRMAMAAQLPVYALGGVDSPARVRDCLDERASGVAVMGALMRADDPTRFVKELLNA